MIIDIKIPSKGTHLIIGEGVYKVIASRPNGKLTLKLMGRRKIPLKQTNSQEALKKFGTQISKIKVITRSSAP